MRRSGRRWLLAFPLALALGVAVLPLAKGPVDDALAGQARAALRAAGVDGVEVASDWARITLVGPAERRLPALTAVDAMPDRGAVDTVVYRSAAAPAAAPSGSPSPAPSGSPSGSPSPSPSDVPVDVVVAVTGSGDARTVTLSGTVAGAQRAAALRAAVAGWAGGATVRDELAVVEGDPTDAVRTAFPAFLRLAGRAAGTFAAGDVRLGAQGLTVEGTTTTQAAEAAVTAIADEAAARGVPVAVAAAGPVTVARQRLDGVRDLRGVSFERGSERLTKRSRATLDRAAAAITMLSGVVVEIRGYSDSKGPADLNKRLSSRRAAAVRDYLVDRGVPRARLRAVGLGEKDPVASNATDAGRAANRRIEFVVKES